jgi:hypothetical protein
VVRVVLLHVRVAVGTISGTRGGKTAFLAPF